VEEKGGKERPFTEKEKRQRLRRVYVFIEEKRKGGGSFVFSLCLGHKKGSEACWL